MTKQISRMMLVLALIAWAVPFQAEEAGEYLIQCVYRCGCCHEEMFAILEVRGPNGEPPPEDMLLTLPPRVMCPLHDH